MLDRGWLKRRPDGRALNLSAAGAEFLFDDRRSDDARCPASADRPRAPLAIALPSGKSTEGDGMRWNRWIGMLAGAVLAGATAVATTTAAAAPPDPVDQCKVNAPPGLWPGDYVDLGQGEWDANLHSGLNSDFTKQVRPIGRVRAVMIFVDFADAQAANANPNQGGRDWTKQQSYWDFLKQSVDFFNASLQRPLPARRRPRDRQVVPDAEADHGVRHDPRDVLDRQPEGLCP